MLDLRAAIGRLVPRRRQALVLRYDRYDAGRRRRAHRRAAQGRPGTIPRWRPHLRYLDALQRHLEASGIEVVWDTQLVGHRRFYVSDCFENRLELIERVPSQGAG